MMRALLLYHYYHAIMICCVKEDVYVLRRAMRDAQDAACMSADRCHAVKRVIKRERKRDMET